jgi:protein-tyrosine phosphatase
MAGQSTPNLTGGSSDRLRRPATTLGGIDAPKILLLCTANQCRSPMAEGVLRHLLAGRRVSADVSSAGLYEGGAPATGTAREVLARRGIDLAAHRSRRLEDPGVELAGADLVIGMERRHVQEAALLGAVRSRCFTLPELARRAAAAEPRRAGESMAAWAGRLSSGRTFAEFVGIGPSRDEIADPIGRSEKVYEATADLLTELLRTIVERAFPPASAEHVA